MVDGILYWFCDFLFWKKNQNCIRWRSRWNILTKLYSPPVLWPRAVSVHAGVKLPRAGTSKDIFWIPSLNINIEGIMKKKISSQETPYDSNSNICTEAALCLLFRYGPLHNQVSLTEFVFLSFWFLGANLYFSISTTAEDVYLADSAQVPRVHAKYTTDSAQVNRVHVQVHRGGSRSVLGGGVHEQSRPSKHPQL